MTKFKGYLDRLRENLETLDEQIENARKMSKVKKKGDNRVALQYSKTLRDLVELRDKTLINIKAHLLGRDETGAVHEPSDVYSGNQEVEFERAFKTFMAPWTAADLKLKCDDCGKESEEVTTRHIQRGYESDYFDLCNECSEKRKTQEPEAGSDV
ncbi:MAG: hypothetical protein NTX81_01030 [Candidatus Bathyarchaeota archaeon]|nr:hypothetical protein [Candidatus Bathyarchaeota archaeon]